MEEPASRSETPNSLPAASAIRSIRRVRPPGTISKGRGRAGSGRPAQRRTAASMLRRSLETGRKKRAPQSRTKISETLSATSEIGALAGLWAKARKRSPVCEKGSREARIVRFAREPRRALSRPRVQVLSALDLAGDPRQIGERRPVVLLRWVTRGGGETALPGARRSEFSRGSAAASGNSCPSSRRGWPLARRPPRPAGRSSARPARSACR